jgi:hypothetical protein
MLQTWTQLAPLIFQPFTQQNSSDRENHTHDDIAGLRRFSGDSRQRAQRPSASRGCTSKSSDTVSQGPIWVPANSCRSICGKCGRSWPLRKRIAKKTLQKFNHWISGKSQNERTAYLSPPSRVTFALLVLSSAKID